MCKQDSLVFSIELCGYCTWCLTEYKGILFFFLRKNGELWSNKEEKRLLQLVSSSKNHATSLQSKDAHYWAQTSLKFPLSLASSEFSRSRSGHRSTWWKAVIDAAFFGTQIPCDCYEYKRAKANIDQNRNLLKALNYVNTSPISNIWHNHYLTWW